MTEVLAAVSGATGLVATIFEVITDNPVLLFFLGASLVPVGFKIFKMAKGTAK